MGDYFGIRSGEAFAAQRLAEFRSVLRREQHHHAARIKARGSPPCSNNNYLWAYGCGAGSFTSVGGMGNTGQYNDGTTTELVDADTKAVFTMFLGSWLGDWDSEDNIMRGVLLPAKD